MPRVNRDLQRRMAARRERERRRPTTERAYQFAAAQPVVESEEELADSDGDETSTSAIEPAARPSRSARATLADGQAPAHHQSPEEFKAEYAYVVTDLHRVALVVGSLLVALIVLYFVLPH